MSSGVMLRCAIGLLLAVLLCVYWPGLAGPFWLDDFNNLGPLGDAGGVHSWDAALRFIMGNGSGPLGRPLTMASFLLNAQNWPADPWWFKFTNVVIHTMNALLVCGLLTILLRPKLGARAGFWALWVAAVWALHPLQVSGVLYVIQRMNLLSGSLVLAGLLLYSRARLAVDATDRRRYIGMAAGMLLSVTGVLAKENAVLAVLYVLVLEWTVLAAIPGPAGFVRMRWLCVYLPALGLLGVIGSMIPGALESAPFRGYSWLQHVLTEPRVLFQYVSALYWPDIRGMGLYHDDVAISVSFWQPLSAGVSVMAWCVLAVGAWLVRARHPYLALTVLWFLAGHMLESTVIPLEVYFEHRNYLPSIGVLLLPALLLMTYAPRLSQWMRVFVVGAPLLVLVLLLQAWTVVWGSGLLLANHVAKYHPESPRAQRMWASALEHNGMPEEADKVIADIIEKKPGDISLALYRVTLACQFDLPGGMTIGQALHVPIIRANYSSFEAMERLVNTAYRSQCPQAPRAGLHAMLERLETDPLIRMNGLLLSKLYYMHADMYVAEQNLGGAMHALDQAYEAYPTLDVAVRRAVLLGSAGLYTQALEAVSDAQRHDTLRKKGIPSRYDELAVLEQVYRARLNEAGDSTEGEIQ